MDSNQTHGHDGVSVRMLKLSSLCIIKLFLIISRNCLKFEAFPDNWKKGSVVSVHKKDNKRTLYPCYLYASKLVFDPIFEFIIESNLLSSTQSDFKPNDSCVNQLTTMTHSIFSLWYLLRLIKGI